MKKMYRVIKTGFSLSETTLVSEDYLNDFIYQHREVQEMILIESSDHSLINVQLGKVVDCSETGVKTQINKAIQALEEQDVNSTWKTLNLFRFEIEVFIKETFYLFSREQEKAQKEFAEWCIFDAIDVQLVA